MKLLYSDEIEEKKLEGSDEEVMFYTNNSNANELCGELYVSFDPDLIGNKGEGKLGYTTIRTAERFAASIPDAPAMIPAIVFQWEFFKQLEQLNA